MRYFANWCEVGHFRVAAIVDNEYQAHLPTAPMVAYDGKHS